MNKDIEIPNILHKNNDGKVNIDNEINRLERIAKTNRIISFFLVILISAIIISLFVIIKNNTAIKFALSHKQEATIFANGYYTMEEETNKAAKSLINDWVQKSIVK